MSFFAEDIFIIIISYYNCKTFLLQCEKAAENGIKNPPQIAQQKQKSPGFGAFMVFLFVFYNRTHFLNSFV